MPLVCCFSSNNYNYLSEPMKESLRPSKPALMSFFSRLSFLFCSFVSTLAFRFSVRLQTIIKHHQHANPMPFLAHICTTSVEKRLVTLKWNAAQEAWQESDYGQGTRTDAHFFCLTLALCRCRSLRSFQASAFFFFSFCSFFSDLCTIPNPTSHPPIKWKSTLRIAGPTPRVHHSCNPDTIPSAAVCAAPGSTGAPQSNMSTQLINREVWADLDSSLGSSSTLSPRARAMAAFQASCSAATCARTSQHLSQTLSDLQFVYVTFAELRQSTLLPPPRRSHVLALIQTLCTSQEYSSRAEHSWNLHAVENSGGSM